MKVFKELAIIIGILLFSYLIQKLSQIPVPAPVLGMILLLVSLLIGIVKLEDIELVSKFFLDHLTFLFVPSGVGLMLVWGIIKEQWAVIFLIALFTTFLAMGITGITVELVKKLREGGPW
ncbi:MAG: CidA/LrgA family protein [Tissierellaceae bacterium]